MSNASIIVENGGMMPSPIEKFIIEGFWGDVGDVAKSAAEGFADGAKQGWREAIDEYRAKHGYGGYNGYNRTYRNNWMPDLEDENGQGLLDIDNGEFAENMKYRTLDYARQFTDLAASIGLGRYRFDRRIIIPSQLPEQRSGYIVPFAVEMEPIGSDGSDLPRITFGCKYDDHGTLVGFWATDKSTRKSVETQRDMPPRRDIPMKHRLASLVNRLRDQILG